MDYPVQYRWAVRVLLRFAVIMLVVGVLSGIAFRESAKKYAAPADGPGLSVWDATLHLALVHGHVLLVGALLPVAIAGMLHLARAHGGADLSARALKWTVYPYVAGVAATTILMLYKGYHFLLHARHGATDFAQVERDYFGGVHVLRYTVNGLSHAALGLGLIVFCWCLWRSLGRRE